MCKVMKQGFGFMRRRSSLFAKRVLGKVRLTRGRFEITNRSYTVRRPAWREVRRGDDPASSFRSIQCDRAESQESFKDAQRLDAAKVKRLG